jgi:hypothetical protein
MKRDRYFSINDTISIPSCTGNDEEYIIKVTGLSSSFNLCLACPTWRYKKIEFNEIKFFYAPNIYKIPRKLLKKVLGHNDFAKNDPLLSLHLDLYAIRNMLENMFYKLDYIHQSIDKISYEYGQRI